jgi:hypothetical protein
VSPYDNCHILLFMTESYSVDVPLYAGAFNEARAQGRSKRLALTGAEQDQLWNLWRVHEPSLDAVVKQCERENHLPAGRATMAYVSAWRPAMPLPAELEAWRARGVCPVARSYPRVKVGNTVFRVLDAEKKLKTTASGCINEYLRAVRREGKRAAGADVEESVHAYGVLRRVLEHKAYDHPNSPTLAIVKLDFLASVRANSAGLMVVHDAKGDDRRQEDEKRYPFRAARNLVGSNIIYVPNYDTGPRGMAGDSDADDWDHDSKRARKQTLLATLYATPYTSHATLHASYARKFHATPQRQRSTRSRSRSRVHPRSCDRPVPAHAYRQSQSSRECTTAITHPNLRHLG